VTTILYFFWTGFGPIAETGPVLVFAAAGRGEIFRGPDRGDIFAALPPGPIFEAGQR
jgi:hypothetical protein